MTKPEVSPEVQEVIKQFLEATDPAGPDGLQVDCSHKELGKVIDYINSKREE